MAVSNKNLIWTLVSQLRETQRFGMWQRRIRGVYTKIISLGVINCHSAYVWQFNVVASNVTNVCSLNGLTTYHSYYLRQSDTECNYC